MARQLLEQVNKARLSDFDNEDPTTYGSVINSALYRLDFAQVPVYLIEETVLEAMCLCTVGEFKNHFRTLRSIKDPITKSLQTILKEAETQFVHLQKNGRWHPEKKAGSMFQTQGEKLNIETDSPVQSALNTTGTAPGQQGNKDAQGRFITDRRGNKIDYTGPKNGEPHQRKNPVTQKDEGWCEKCPHPRWGNHTTDQHDNWVAKVKNAKAKRSQQKQTDDSPPAADAGTNNVTDNNDTAPPRQRQVRFAVATLASSTAAQIHTFGTSAPF